MDYQRGRSGRPSRRGTDTFTGEVLLDEVVGAGNTMVNSVFFEPGARTYWHSHGAGQVLLVGHGKGVVATRDGPRQVVQAGDAVYTPAGEVHWHGAAPDSFLLHTAVSMGQTQWMDEVSDDDYAAAWQDATG